MAHNNPTTVPPMTAIFAKERKIGKISKKYDTKTYLQGFQVEQRMMPKLMAYAGEYISEV